VIGAWALGACGRARATLDLDFLVMVDEEGLLRLVALMAQRGMVADAGWQESSPMLRGSQMRFQGVLVDVLRPDDIWIAASARQHGLRFLTTDAHYRKVNQVIVDYFETF
jgi:predicted nucleic acid-binding protein